LRVQKSAELDVVLKVGELTTTVEVSAEAAQLATTTSTVSTTVDNKKVLDLPTERAQSVSSGESGAGRYPGQLQQRIRRVDQRWTKTPTPRSPWMALRSCFPENNVSIQQTGADRPLVDSIEEFTVITNALAAEIGRTAGGAFNIATRSGTNQIHGTGFEFLRNSALNANTWSNNRNGVKKTGSKNHQFGGALGGPLVIPRLLQRPEQDFSGSSANRAIGNRNAMTGTATVPIDAWRNGDFSNLKDGNGRGGSHL